MEGGNIPKLTSEIKCFQIPIEEYEKDMETESAKEKKKEILDLFTNSNNLRSKEEFDEIKNNLHQACKEGDLELIKILLCISIENDSKDLKFKIDKANQTASLYKVSDNVKDIIIPRTVQHESTNYLITSIKANLHYFRTLTFSVDSAIKTIYADVFALSRIKEIYFPASLKELKKGWCRGADELQKINISPTNDKFIFKNNQYLLGKSDENKNEFDIFLFAIRSIKEISIPSNIKIISSYAFHYCNKLTKVEIPKNSRLQTIESNAFSLSNIRKIFIPSNVSKICEYSFYYCNKLTKIEIPRNSKLQIIESNAFSKSTIEDIFIPPNVLKIGKSAFENCENLVKVEIPTNSYLKTIGSNAFSCSKIEEIFIPPNVLEIFESAFRYCKNLVKIEISPNSNLQTIESNAFFDSSIESIYFPASLKELKEGWCCGVKELKNFNISPLNDKFVFKDNKYLLGKSDENKDEFDILLFANRDIKEAFIPSNIKIISSCAFECCFYLTKFEIQSNSKLQTIGSNEFSYSNIKEIFIPPNVTKICELTFNHCDELTKVEIPTNSNLQTIEKDAFSWSKIEEIYFPASLKELKKGWCHLTRYLKKIIISPSNSKFIFKDNQYLLGKSDENKDEFDILFFANRYIEEAFIPSNIKIIESFAFYDCNNLRKVEIPPDSKLQAIDSDAFSFSNIIEIFLPPNISKICEQTFHDRENLIKVEILTDNKKTNISTKKELLMVPNIDIPFDCYSILSLSLISNGIIIITKDYKAILCNDLIKKNFEVHKFEKYQQDLFPISGYKCINYDFYMVSKIPKGFKTMLVKNGHYLEIGYFNPVAIFGGTLHCAAIDHKGAILYIPNSFNDDSFALIETKYLPNDEKAVDIACLSNFLYVLSSTGKLYMSKNANSFNISFKQVDQFQRINVIQISGTFEHILVLTEEGKVYSSGRNLYGELGTGDKKSRLNKFFEISSLNHYKIRYVSAGVNHSLFLTSEGEMLACGNNGSGQCFYENKSDDVSTVLPIETPFHKGVDFCISSQDSVAVCIGFDPEMSPNRRVKDDINILLLGYEKKNSNITSFC